VNDIGRLRKCVRSNVFRAGQIRNRPRHLHDPVVGARAEVHSVIAIFNISFVASVERAEFLLFLRPDARVASDLGLVRETFLLPLARGDDTRADSAEVSPVLVRRKISRNFT